MDIRIKNKLGLISTSFLIVLNIFIFIPFTLRLGNIGEFSVPFTAIISYFIIPGVILGFLLISIGLFLKIKNFYERYISLVFILGILLWLQGMVVVWKYGELDGRGINWAEYTWRGLIDGVLWIVLLALGWFFYKKIYRAAATGSIVLVTLQLVYLVFMSVQNPEIWRNNGKFSPPGIPKKEIFEFSSKLNVIHIILDEFQSNIFQEIIDEDTKYYYSALEGFTFFKETTGSFPTTVVSIPAILSGKNYKNDIPMGRFIRTVFNGRTVPNVLYDNGYDVDLIHTIRGYCGKGRYSYCYPIPTPYGLTEKYYKKVKMAFMLDLVLFRCAPHFLKKLVYNNQLWTIQRLFKVKDFEQIRYFAHYSFFQDLISRMVIKRNKPLFKFVHIATTHNPIVVNEDCEYAGKILQKNRKNVKVQARCGLKQILEFFDKLKLLGIYDSSVIILNADHGYFKLKDSKRLYEVNKDDMKQNNDCITEVEYSRVLGSALPLMAIKPPHSKGPLRISNVQTELTDIPATIADILNLNEKFVGRSVYKILPNEIRERRFYYYPKVQSVPDKFFDSLSEYIIKGSVFKRASWQRGLTFFPPKKLSYFASEIDFGTDEVSKFLRHGWVGRNKKTKKGVTFNQTIGNSASIFLSLPKTKAIRLTANIKAGRLNKPPVVTVMVDNLRVGAWKLSPNRQWQKFSIRIEPNLHRADVSIIDFYFSDCKITENNKVNFSVMVESISLKEIPYIKPTP